MVIFNSYVTVYQRVNWFPRQAEHVSLCWTPEFRTALVLGLLSWSILVPGPLSMTGAAGDATGTCEPDLIERSANGHRGCLEMGFPWVPKIIQKWGLSMLLGFQGGWKTHYFLGFHGSTDFRCLEMAGFIAVQKLAPKQVEPRFQFDHVTSFPFLKAC